MSHNKIKNGLSILVLLLMAAVQTANAEVYKDDLRVGEGEVVGSLDPQLILFSKTPSAEYVQSHIELYISWFNFHGYSFVSYEPGNPTTYQFEKESILINVSGNGYSQLKADGEGRTHSLPYLIHNDFSQVRGPIVD